MADRGETRIFAQGSYQVDFYSTNPDADRIVFSFTEFGNTLLDHTGFGGDALLRAGFDVLVFKSVVNNWFQDLPSAALEAAEAFLANGTKTYRWRASYGSSMGAYAALLFARRLQLDVAFAISPQADIAQNWDMRWRADGARLGPLAPISDPALSYKCRYVVAYDPFDEDALHVAAIMAMRPPGMVTGLRLYGSGHPSGLFLSQSGCLKPLSFAVLSGETPPDLRSRVRAHRRLFPTYFFVAARWCMARNKLRWADRLIRAGAAIDPLNAEIQHLAALIQDRLDQYRAGVPFAAAAVALYPQHPVMISTLSRLLRKNGLLTQSLHYAERALQVAPEAEQLKADRDSILALIG